MTRALLLSLILTGCAHETYWSCRQHGGDRDICFITTAKPEGML